LLTDAREREIADRIYEAAFDDAALARLGATVAETVGADQAGVSSRRRSQIVEISIHGPPQASTDYLAHYWRLDPWTPAILALDAGCFAYGDALVPTATVRESEFYVDFAAPQGVLFPMCGRLALDNETDVLVSVNRPGRSLTFNESERQALERLGEHVRRTLQLRGRFEAARAMALASAADALTFGLALVAADGRVLFANPALEELTRERCGVGFAGGRLSATCRGDGERLAKLVWEAGLMRRGGAMVLRWADGRRALSVLATPAMPRNPFGLPSVSDKALVAFSPLGATNAPASDLARTLFGLSPAEAAIVEGLWTGASTREIAERRQVKLSTLKTQLDAVYRKTGAANQGDLLRLLAGLPQLRTRRSE
jgi:DNA-binding CsgD family transcriptional regulator